MSGRRHPGCSYAHRCLDRGLRRRASASLPALSLNLWEARVCQCAACRFDEDHFAETGDRQTW